MTKKDVSTLSKKVSVQPGNPQKRKYGNVPSGIYKSKLEQTCANLLVESEIDFEYEPWEVILIDSFTFEYPSYERIGKEFKEQRAKLRKTSYKPDFIGDGWVIETKGKRTPDFQLKWKLFKRYLMENEQHLLLFMPTSKKEIVQSITVIKNLQNDK
jgi:hypothetical protein